MSKEIEKEVRYLIDENIKNEISKKCELVKKSYYTIDIVVGLDGFNSLNNYGYILRIRDKGKKKYVENKRRLENGDFIEQRIEVDDVKTPLNFFMNMGYEPYLVIEREREELNYKSLKIFVDNISLLGTFVEIEYQDNDLDVVKEFIEMFNIISEPQDLYGDIFKRKVLEEEFRVKFDELVKRCIK